jgi:hypothetical protein
MAEMDDAMAELRHRIMGQLKPARPQHQQTKETSKNNCYYFAGRGCTE